MQYAIVPVSLACLLLVACSDGVQLGSDGAVSHDAGALFDGSPSIVSAEGAISDAAATAAINHPANRIDEPAAVNWVGASRQRLGDCSSGPGQNAQEAFATDGFIRVDDANGNYLLATSPADNPSPQYAEFCLTVNELARYRINATVRAPGIFEDSFFVTVDEDAPGTVAEPGIYDVLNTDEFKTHVVRVRTESPLILTLAPGEHVVRFYLREPNSALRGIELESVGPVPPVPDPDTPQNTDIAQCASNTGMSVAAIDSLISEYLGNIQPRFVLQPAEEERGYFIRNDYRWETAEGSGNIMCLALPPEGGTNLIDNTITEGRIVFGSQGIDLHRAATRLHGTFIGNGGNDRVGVIDGGVFDAGPGDDYVELIRSGILNAGPGDDKVGVMRGGQFNGGIGDDSLVTQYSGTFDGGDGNDSVSRQSSNAQLIAVENSEVYFEPLPAPTDIVFADSTRSTTLVKWTASTDMRVQGYLLNISRDPYHDISVELGAPPISLSPLNTPTNQQLIEYIVEEDPVIQVRAYTELDDGTYLYSDPLEGVFDAPDGGGVQFENIIATAELFDTRGLASVTLSANGSALFVNSIAPTNSATPLFLRLDSQLQNETPVFNDTAADTSYNSYSGDERQYIASRSSEEGRTVVTAFNGDASAVVWEQDVADVSPIVGGSVCPAGLVTQDDWLICLDYDGRVEAFDPDGMHYSRPAGTIETRNTVIDGAKGILIEIDETQQPNSLNYTVLNIVSGEIVAVSLDLGSLADDTEFSPVGLVVDGDHIVLTGGFVRECATLGNCRDDIELSEGFFVLRALIADGSVSAYIDGPSEARAGGGFAKLIDRTIYFSRENGFSSYNADTLELISRRTVPGTVRDVGDGGVLSQEYISDAENFVEGYRLILSTP